MKRFSILMLAFTAMIMFFASCQKEDEISENNDSNNKQTATFEDNTLEVESYWDGSDSTGAFVSGGVTFENTFSVTDYGDSWAGFAYSNMTDDTTADLANQFSAYAGGGANGSSTYGIFFPAFDSVFYMDFEKEVTVESMMITNTTYAALAMRDGSQFSQPLDSGDWYEVTIVGYMDTVEVSSKSFMLADFTSPDSTEHYIQKDWLKAELDFNAVNKITFTFDGSDQGQYGLNTPKYVAIDNIIFKE